MSYDSIKALSDKIWYTRKSRIQASQRLLMVESLSQIALYYYTLVILGLSIWSLTLHTGQYSSIPLITVIASVVLFGLSIYIQSKKYGERANALKECYIELDALLLRVNALQERRGSLFLVQQLDNLQKEYNHLILHVENHTQIDYLKSLLNARQKLRVLDWMRLILYYLFWVIVCLILFGVPLVLIFLVAKGVL